MYTLKVREHFDAAHHLIGYEGKCARVHGHRWIVEAEVASEGLSTDSMVEDFGKIKGILRSLLPDHLDLNGVYDFSPTAENLAKALYEQMRARVPGTVSLTVWESPECSCRYELPAAACNGGCRCSA